MAHPAQSAIEAARRKRHHPGGTVEGTQAAVARLDRKRGGGAVDVSSWRPPVAHDVQPLNQEVIETSLDGRKGIADSKGDIPERRKYANGGGIHIKPSHRGMLHADLGVPSGEKIPVAKMEKAKASASPAEKKRITFAENARSWNKG